MGNSVIYRPAYDAEVEYLESTGTQYIDTGIVPTIDTRVVAKLYTEQDANKNWFGGELFYKPNEYLHGFAFNQYNDHIEYLFGNSDWCQVSASYSLLGRVFEVDFSKSALKVDGTTIASNICSSFMTQSLPMLLFWRQSNNTAGLISGRIYYLKIYNNSTLVRDYIPVRIGSIGYMYDKVSKQLFANKGTGQFILGNDVVNATIPQQRCVLYFGNQRSVGFERIYEEYEWLKGDGSAYIDTNRNTLSGDNVSFNFKVASDNISNDILIFGTRESYEEYFIYQNINSLCFSIGYRDGNGRLKYIDTGIRYDAQTIYSYTHEINSKSITTSINNTIYANSITLYNVNSCHRYLFTVKGNSYYDGYMGEFVVKNNNSISLSLTPCKLLQSIPAILDGNGIARQAGECGMWDKVSNKFYGNVANSGTFTVKGPKCYEEYKWLVANGDDLQSSGPQSVALFSFPSDMNLVGKTVQLTMGAPCRDIYVYRYVGAGLYLVLYVWNRNVSINSNNQIIFSSPLVSQEPMVLDFENNLVSYNGQQIQIAGDSFYIYFPSAAIEGKRKYGRIYCQGLFDFTPCKLTHGIPASVDANGIARPAGTCGMWDKVNDKFYGNVASSGSFTVSND